MGPKFHNSKKWLVPNFISKGWEWCIWTITTIIHHQIWSADSTANITVIHTSFFAFYAEIAKATLPKVGLNIDNFELWMTVISAVESADQIWWWIIVVMVHIHHSQPLKIEFGTNHFLGLETFGPIQYRECVNHKVSRHRNYEKKSKLIL